MNNIKVSNYSRLTRVLEGSLKALKHEPVLFAPKLASTFLGALWFVLLLDALKSPPVNPQILPLVFVSMIGLLFVGLSASVLVSAMVDLRGKYSGLALLKCSALESSGKMKDVAVTVLIVVSLIVVSYLIAVMGFLAYYLTEEIVLLGTGVLVSLLVVLGMSYYLYFLPVSLFRKDSWDAALKDSSSVSSENRRDVIILMAFSLLLLAPALYFTGKLETLGYVGFVASRLFSGLVNTYLFTLSPEYYLSAESLD